MKPLVSSEIRCRGGASHLRVSPKSPPLHINRLIVDNRVFHIGLDTEPSTFVVGTTNSTSSGTTIFGPTTFYAFSINFTSTTGLTGLKVQGHFLPFQDSMFVVPSLSSISPSFSELSVINPETYTINITTAVSPGIDPLLSTLCYCSEF